MNIVRLARTIARAASIAMMLLALTAGSALAHAQTIDPNGNADGFTKPISRAWAQAHCNAASPSIVTDRSNGVVAFPPGTSLPCPLVPNPGGEIHGD